MTNADVAMPDEAVILGMVQSSRAAFATGQLAEADQLLARVGQVAPNHPAVLNELGVRMLQRGDAASAYKLLERATRADPGHPALWSNLASSLHALGRFADELEAIERALALEPRHLSSLLQKGNLFESNGDQRNAARVFRNALATIPPGLEVAATVSQALEHARNAVARDDAALAEAIEVRLRPMRERLPGPYRRVQKCVDLLAGRRSRFFPSPSFMFFPELPAIEFFDREEFPWLDSIEAGTEEIRAELTGILASDRSGIEPYIAYPDGVPLDQWRELNRSRRWGAYFLWNQGVAQPARQARCPRTTQMLQAVPQCNIVGHAPTAFFSILDASTRIPAHTGATNVRLTVHLPLIVPPDCGFRVGNETREWITGKAWVFDDTLDHEAWNSADVPRAILIFDIWNPYLTQSERELVSAATEAYGNYYAASPEN